MAAFLVQDEEFVPVLHALRKLWGEERFRLIMNETTRDSLTWLAQGVANDRLEVVKTLLALGADVHRLVIPQHGFSLALLAAERVVTNPCARTRAVLDTVLLAGADVHQLPDRPLGRQSERLLFSLQCQQRNWVRLAPVVAFQRGNRGASAAMQHSIYPLMRTILELATPAVDNEDDVDIEELSKLVKLHEPPQKRSASADAAGAAASAGGAKAEAAAAPAVTLSGYILPIGELKGAAGDDKSDCKETKAAAAAQDDASWPTFERLVSMPELAAREKRDAAAVAAATGAGATSAAAGAAPATSAAPATIRQASFGADFAVEWGDGS